MSIRAGGGHWLYACPPLRFKTPANPKLASCPSHLFPPLQHEFGIKTEQPLSPPPLQREFGFKLDRPVLADDVRVRGTGRSKALPAPPEAVPEPGEGDNLVPEPGRSDYLVLEPGEGSVVPEPGGVAPCVLAKQPAGWVDKLSSGRRKCGCRQSVGGCTAVMWLLRVDMRRRARMKILPPTLTMLHTFSTLHGVAPGLLPEPVVISSAFFEAGGRQPTPVYKLPSLQPRHKV